MKIQPQSHAISTLSKSHSISESTGMPIMPPIIIPLNLSVMNVLSVVLLNPNYASILKVSYSSKGSPSMLDAKMSIPKKIRPDPIGP